MLVARWWVALKQRLYARVSNPAWQAKAGLRWPGRWLAQRQARQLFDLCAGFVYSQTLAACERIGLLDQLAAGPCSRSLLARQLSLSPRSLETLLDAAVGIELVEVRGDHVQLGFRGAALLGNPGVRAMIRHHEHLYQDLQDPLARLGEPEAPSALRSYWAYSGRQQPGDQEALGYSKLMASSQSFIAEQVLHVLDLSRYRSFVDLGGGFGAFAARALRKTPSLSIEVLDLPAVVSAAPQQPGVRFRGVDMFVDPLPAADAYSLVRILHDHDDDQVLKLLRRVRCALPEHGELLIIEPLAGPGARRASQTYFAWYFLAMGQGRLRTREALIELLGAAGFSTFRSISTPVPQLAEILVASGRTEHVKATSTSFDAIDVSNT